MPIICPHCSRKFKGDKINARHKAVCAGWPKSPPPLPCLCGHESTSLTQMKRHRRTCEVWKNRDKQAVQKARTEAAFTEKYGEGVTNARHIPEVEEKRRATVRERYGADNVFCKESTVFDQVQESLEGKRPVLRGKDNPFARPEVQEKIREHWQREHGVDSPQQVAEIRARTRATNLERYGTEEVLASPVVREAIKETCEARYGGPGPSCSPDVRAKAQETNLKRYGVPWTCMDPDVRAKQLVTMEEHYGSHFLASDEGKATIRAVMLERYGVEFPGAMEGHWEKAVATFLERLGVEHPLQLEEYREKQRQTNIERYGTPFPGLRKKGPNGLEQRVVSLAPPNTLLFTGDGSWWRWLPRTGHHKNSDFIAPGPDPLKPKKGVTKVVEAFGDYWHSRIFTGVAPFEHEQELIEAYADIGIECLILWESEVKSDPDGVRGRLKVFLAG